MLRRLYSFTVHVGALSIIITVLYFLFHSYGNPRLRQTPPYASTAIQVANVLKSITVESTGPSKMATTPQSTSINHSAIANEIPAEAPLTTHAYRISKPYNNNPESFDVVQSKTQNALVNIVCNPHPGSTLRSISGSGVIIDSRGVILTNAHVAQYVLISEMPNTQISCLIRTGSPAVPLWSAHVLYIPTVWVNKNASEVNKEHTEGTGEHDYALLRITSSISSTPLPHTFATLPIDTRDAIAFLGDHILGASYPAELFSVSLAQNSLYPMSFVSTINQLLTISNNAVDIVSIGSVAEAQGGSSGGAIVNAWGYLVGIMTTMSNSNTHRDVQAITLSYIDHDLMTQTGSNLSTFLLGDLNAKEVDFRIHLVPNLIKQYSAVLPQ